MQKFELNNKKYNIKKKHSDFFLENGYIIFKNIFSKSEMIELNNSIIQFADKEWHNIMNPDRFEFVLAQAYKKLISLKSLNEKINFITKARTTSELWRKYLIDIRIKKILEKLNRTKFHGLMSHIIFKRAKTKFSQMGWHPHQDNSYCQIKDGLLVTVNLFIHKSNKTNGGLYIYPKSHKLGLLNSDKRKSYHAKSSEKPGNRVKFNLNKFDRVDLINEPGDIYIMHGNLIHGSYPNNSKIYPRHMISFVYGEKNKKFNPGNTAQRKVIEF